MEPTDVLRFWFGPDQPPAFRKVWFAKDPAFDADIRTRFLGTYAAAASGKLGSWERTPRGLLALLIVLDQFPRNMFRGSPLAFGTDPLALELSRNLLAMGWDLCLAPVERIFVYLPLEHSEHIRCQERSVELFKALAEQSPELRDTLVYAELHLRVIRKFGRFPHRNRILGRSSTPTETEFLRRNPALF